MLTKQPKPANRPAIRHAWAAGCSAAHRVRSAGDAMAEMGHLKRADVLSQPFPILHVRTHLDMLGNGILPPGLQGVTGQLMRRVVAGPGSAARRCPLGNLCGANVDATVPMPIPADLAAVLADAGPVAP